MRILCLIDALGPGGAERQMAGLSKMLKEYGHNVCVCYHEPKHFFVDQIRAAGVQVTYVPEAVDKKKRVSAYYNHIKAFMPDVVIAYLQAVCITACIVKMLGLNFKLIVSERNTNTSKALRDYVRFNLYRLADYVVPNSYSQANFINGNFKFLKHKVRTITNFVDTEKFVPGLPHKRENLIIVVATIWPSKNTLGFIQALDLLRKRGVTFIVKWFGKVPGQSEYICQCENKIIELNLSPFIELLDKTQDIISEYQKADFFCLPSFYEGTPNALCEAMSCGLPVICSDVCDNSNYVQKNYNGMMFNPNSAEDIADALEYMLKLNDDDWRQYSKNSREKALEHLSTTRFIESYINIIN